MLCGLWQLTLIDLAHSQPIDSRFDVNLYRIPLPNEGYLTFQDQSATGSGAELTGWTDVRHPAMEGSLSSTRGYDFYDNQVVILTHNVNAPIGDSRISEAERRRDFDVTNAVFAQVGITVRQEANTTSDGLTITLSSDLSLEPSISELLEIDRSPNPSTVNMYYVADLPFSSGIALPPQYAMRGGFAHGGFIPPTEADSFPALNDGFVVTDYTAINSEDIPLLDIILPTTFPHELGHMLLDDYRFSPEGDFHSTTNQQDLMYWASTFPDVSQHKIPVEKFGFVEVGRRVGSIGTTSYFEDTVSRMGEDLTVSQTEAIHRSPLVQRESNNGTHGDRADFDFVVDDIVIDRATTTGDFSPNAESDPLVWEIGLLNESPHVHDGHDGHDIDFDHDHGDWLSGNEPELDMGVFDGDSFRTVDVVSQIARYADMDVDPETGLWSARNSALDYQLEFSPDGEDWLEGSVVNVFIPGWNPNSKADDYVARWSSPVAAQFVRIRAAPLGDTHDGNVQIDAIIASADIVSTVPEPSGTFSIWLGAAMLLAMRRRQRIYNASLGKANTFRLLPLS